MTSIFVHFISFLAELLDFVAEPVKGELVLVVGPGKPVVEEDAKKEAAEEAARLLAEAEEGCEVSAAFAAAGRDGADDDSAERCGVDQSLHARERGRR